LLAPLGFALKVFRKPVAITIHGLDITYKSKIYQFLIPRCIKRCSKIICISNATKEECIKRGIAEEKIAVIPDGVSDEFYLNASKAAMLAKVADKLKLNLSGKKILLSVGRLVERKGIHWFVEKVIPQILEKGRDFVYLVVGEGLFREEIKGIIAKKGLEEHVLMLGRVDDETLKVLYNVADIFIMPNIPVEGDMEGFGVVALEASSCSLPVVASNLEGIKDAVKDGKNGLLIEPYNVASFSGTIIKLLEDNAERLEFGKSAREFTLENYSWEKIGEKYRQVYSELM
jgi:glycosyltransferase involved in cell wall biosynthesis